MDRVRVAVLVSGSGTILQSMVESGLDIAVVGSDRPCRALEVASEVGIDTLLVERGDFGGFSKSFNRSAYTVALTTQLEEKHIDLVAMAGSDFVRGGSERLCEAMVVHGDEAAVLARINEHRQAGANHVCLQVLGSDLSKIPYDDWRALGPVVNA